jgi:formylglycine-generating enzyme required for sulfatase activity
MPRVLRTPDNWLRVTVVTALFACAGAHAWAAPSSQEPANAAHPDNPSETTKGSAEAGPGSASTEVIVVRSGPPGHVSEQPIVAGSAKTFTDCEPSALCPQMLVIPSSPRGVLLGSLETEKARQDDEKLRSVTIKAFAIGKSEVSVGEYERCVEAGECRPPEWREPGSQFNVETGTSTYYRSLGPNLSGKDFPIVGVSYDDAVSYAAWLSRTTGQPYRLPSEAEWEYAARADTRSAYWWGDDAKPAGKVMASCRGCGSTWDAQSNAPVVSFEPNPWGLHNVHGNVWEWTADFYCADYSSGPADGSARSKDDCPEKDAPNLHVLRGGSSFYEPRFMRSAVRLRNYNTFRNFSVGFRVARTLLP